MRVVQTKQKYKKIWSACFVGTTRAKFGLIQKKTMEYDQMVER